MIFKITELEGAFIIEPEKIEDQRGFFARGYCDKEFDAYGLNSKWVQCNISFNKIRSTLRGMHYQSKPHREVKLVRCTAGAIYDVIIDLRPDSLTYKKWTAAELTSENHKMLYVPKGFAHGYQTLTENSEVFYFVSEFYAPGFEQGIRWDDPHIGITWPEPAPSVISDKDKHWPDYFY